MVLYIVLNSGGLSNFDDNAKFSKSQAGHNLNIIYGKKHSL